VVYNDLVSGWSTLKDSIVRLTGDHTLVVISNVNRFPAGHPKGETIFYDQLREHLDVTLLPPGMLHPDYRRAGQGGCSVYVAMRRTTGGGSGGGSGAGGAGTGVGDGDGVGVCSAADGQEVSKKREGKSHRETDEGDQPKGKKSKKDSNKKKDKKKDKKKGNGT
jgi:hypothetical protein